MNKVEFSIIVPVYNEAENIKKLHEEIVLGMKKLGNGFEIILVDDGSSDGSFEIMSGLKPVKVIKLRRNEGQSAALDAGIKAAEGKYIITLDGDGQNDPADFIKLWEALGDNDVVCGWRWKRQDSFSKKFISRGARFIRKFLVDDGIHDSGCTLRIYRSECFEDIDLYGEMHRMIPAMLKWRGFKVTEVKVNHRPRLHGKTKYNFWRTFKGMSDMIYIWFWRNFESRPNHLFGALGLVLMILSIGLLFGLGIMRAFYGYQLSNKIWPLVAVGGLVSGIQLMIFGFLANMILGNRKDKKFYGIKEIIINE